MTQLNGNGIKSLPSMHTVDQTVERLRTMLQAKGITLFAVVDHSGEADKAGIKMPPTRLLIFGNPGAGTPLMLAAPTSAIDLPLKMLIWQEDKDMTWNDPAYLQARHGFPAELTNNIAAVGILAANAAA